MNNRYIRQTILPELGPQGQAALGRARVLVVGAGGLGSPILLYLTAAGVGLGAKGGYIGIVDDDTVDASNLHRQIVFKQADVSHLKTESALRHLRELNDEVKFKLHSTRLSTENAPAIFQDYNIIVDGSDNFATKYLVNDIAAEQGKPVVYGSIIGFEGQVSVFWPPRGPCYRCLHPENTRPLAIPNCSIAGTMGAVAGVMGSIQALEVCKLAMGIEQEMTQHLKPLIGELLIMDARDWNIHKLQLPVAPKCPICRHASQNTPIIYSARTPNYPPAEASLITHEELAQLQRSQIPLILLDVREQEKWAQNHLRGAVNVPLMQLLSDEIPPNLLAFDSIIVVYCQRGLRSTQAAAYLHAKGYRVRQLMYDGSDHE